MVRLVAHRIINGIDLTFSKEEYSKFKYGKESLAEQFALELLARNWTSISTQINALNKEKVSIVVYGAPYNEIPVASTILANYFTDFLNKMSKDITVSRGKISRQHSYHDDYGKMDAAKRSESLAGETFEFVTNPDEYDIAIFVDDIYITGAHETRVYSLIERSNVKAKCVFMYYAKLEENVAPPEFESELNMCAISNDEAIINHFKQIFDDSDYEFNTRTVKFLLSQDFKTVLSPIMDHAGKIIVNEFLAYCEMNNYYNHEKYAQNYQLINELYS